MSSLTRTLPFRGPALYDGGYGLASPSVALLPHLGGFADPVTQVVELRPSDVAAGDTLDLGENRGVDGEGPLDPNAEAHFAHGEGLATSAALAPYDNPLEQLHALAVALHDAHVNFERVAGGEIGDVAAELGAVDEIGGVHWRLRLGARDASGRATRRGTHEARPLPRRRAAAREGRGGASWCGATPGLDAIGPPARDHHYGAR